MQIGPSGLPLPVPIPMWYYNPCFRLPENPLHPAFTRALYAPVSPTQNSPHAPNSPYLMNECTTTAPSTPEETTPSIPNDKSDPALKMESKGKNTSFSIEAILELGENRRETPSEQKESKALSDRRHQRVLDSAHPYVTSSSSYTTNHHHHHHHHHHHPFNVHNEQLAVLRESTNILIEDDITPRMSNTASHVASMVTPDWKHQSPHHHHHHHHQPASQQHQQHPHHHHHQQQQQVPPNSHPTGHLEPRPTSISQPRVQTKTSSSSVKSGKRVRTIFTPEQLEQLELEFSRQQYMVGTERYYLAGKLSLSEVQVKVWFQNRRIKMRKQQQEAIKEHFAQCRFLNTSESEEEDEEEDEEEGGGERGRVEEGRREENQEEGEGEGEDLEEEEGVEERERERRVDSDNSHLLLKYHQKMKNLRDLVTEHCPRD